MLFLTTQRRSFALIGVFLIVLLSFLAWILPSYFLPNINMINLLENRPHLPLIRMKINYSSSRSSYFDSDSEELLFLNNANYGPTQDMSKYKSRFYNNFDAEFTFSDGSSCEAKIQLPNNRNFFVIVYPIDNFSADPIDDKRTIVDITNEESKCFCEFFKDVYDAMNFD